MVSEPLGLVTGIDAHPWEHIFIEPNGEEDGDHCGDGIAPTPGPTFRSLRLPGFNHFQH